MYTEKISKALASASAYLQDIDSKAETGENMMLVWKATSDLEYALFIFSLVDQETRNLSRRLPSSKRTEIESLFSSTRKLLQEASESLKADLKEAHKKTWLAQSQLLKIHDFYKYNRRK